MTQPSKGAAAFLTLFGLPFLGAGLAFMYAQFVSRGNFSAFQTVAAILFGSVFVFIGGVLIYAAIGGYGQLKKQAAIEESHPLSPWLWRTDWAMRRAESQNKKNEILFWSLAILCNMITHAAFFSRRTCRWQDSSEVRNSRRPRHRSAAFLRAQSHQRLR